MHSDLLFHREKVSDEWKIVIPEILQRSLIEAIHVKLGHPGVYKTLGHLRKF